LDFVQSRGNNRVVVMVDGATHRRSGRPPSRAVLVLLTALGLQTFTYCAGKSSEEDDSSKGGTTSGTSNGGDAGVSSGGVSSGGVSSGGVSSGGTDTGGVNTGGFAGHTSGCATDPCAPGCGFCGGAGQGGVAGQGGNGGFAGAFAGHTGSCMCGPGCSNVNCGGAGQGGVGGAGNGGDAGRSGSAGFAGFAGFAGHTGSGFANLPSDEKPEPMAIQPSVHRGCYVLGGFENDPCLPADDAVLAWLDQRPGDCEPRVAAGPFNDYDGHVRKCCYSLSCEKAATPHGLR
jgi:hypothetical protein